MLPFMAGENDRFVFLIPLSFWIYLSFFTNDFGSYFCVILGIFIFLWAQYTRNVIDSKIKDKQINTPLDLNKFLISKLDFKDIFFAIYGLLYFVISLGASVVYWDILCKSEGFYFIFFALWISFGYAITELVRNKEKLKFFAKPK